jgi:cytochrome c553
MRRNHLTIFALLAACALGSTQAEAAADDRLGAFLAETCVTCHQAQVVESAMPGITGWDEAKFTATMKAFRTDAEAEPIMRAVAASLSDGEVAALARYLATQEP